MLIFVTLISHGKYGPYPFAWRWCLVSPCYHFPWNITTGKLRLEFAILLHLQDPPLSKVIVTSFLLVASSLWMWFLFSSSREPWLPTTHFQLLIRYIGITYRVWRWNNIICLPPWVVYHRLWKICFEFKSARNTCTSYQKVLPANKILDHDKPSQWKESKRVYHENLIKSPDGSQPSARLTVLRRSS